MASKIARKIFIINRKFQFHFMGLLMGGLLASMLIFTLGFLSVVFIQNTILDSKFDEYLIVNVRVEMSEAEIASQRAQEGFDPSPRSNTDESTFFKTVPVPMRPFEYILPYILMNNVFILLIISILALNLSHRLAGPIYRINKTIEAAVQGPLERPIKLRKKDFFQETAHKLNTLFKKTEIL
jgi:methyl-accepting chemotaxis protein